MPRQKREFSVTIVRKVGDREPEALTFPLVPESTVFSLMYFLSDVMGRLDPMAAIKGSMLRRKWYRSRGGYRRRSTSAAAPARTSRGNRRA